MSSPLSILCKRYEKWQRLVILVHHAGTKICHNLLHAERRFPNDRTELSEFVRINEKHIKPDKYQKLILYPPDQRTVESNFDITLYTKIIQGLYGWEYNRLVDDLRKLRNNIWYKGDPELIEEEFEILWQEVSETLTSHYFDMNSVAGLKECESSRLQEHGKLFLNCIEVFLQGNKKSFVFFSYMLCVFGYLICGNFQGNYFHVRVKKYKVSIYICFFERHQIFIGFPLV